MDNVLPITAKQEVAGVKESETLALLPSSSHDETPLYSGHIFNNAAA